MKKGDIKFFIEAKPTKIFIVNIKKERVYFHYGNPDFVFNQHVTYVKSTTRASYNTALKAYLINELAKHTTKIALIKERLTQVS